MRKKQTNTVTDPEYIRELMLAKLGGVIEATEEQYLDELIETDQEVKDLWQQMQQKYPKEHVDSTLNRYKEQLLPAADIITASQERTARKRTIYRNIAAIAAVLSGITIGLYLFVNNRPSAKLASTESAATGKKNHAIILQLSNGEVVDLSHPQDTTVTGARLNNANKTLSYVTVSGNNHDQADGAMNNLTVPVGMDYHVALSDGSEIWLNSASYLKFPFNFSGTNREIFINGEAYVKVAKNADHPFFVHTPRGTIQVTGTAFNINSYDSGVVKVSLIEGAVRFKSNGKDVTLRPGNEAIYKDDKGITVQQFDEELVLGWRKGHYAFSEATLPEITRVLPRWFGVDVVMDNPALSNERFTGIMNRNKPITVFLDNIKNTMNVQYYFDTNGVLHFK